MLKMWNKKPESTPGRIPQKAVFERPVVADVPVDVSSMPMMRTGSFPADAGPIPWLDRPDAQAHIDAKLKAGEIDAEQADLCRMWSREGYVILERFFDEETLDRVWQEYEDAIASGFVVPPTEPLFEGDQMPGRFANVHFSVEGMDKLLHDARMSRVMSLLLGAKVVPFQTIVGHKSSQQLEHSDSIHMTTYPNGYLTANWIAFEDIHVDSGPLVYYPGSHKLPYIFSEGLGMEPDPSYQEYRRAYEPAVQRALKVHQLQPKWFLPRKGDVLLWHANLLHGGSMLNGAGHPSRKALVCHFFGDGCVCYHDLTGTPAHTQLNQTHRLYRHKGLPGGFDAELYLLANPDVAAAGAPAEEHYLLFGRQEGRSIRP